ncbi:hypothetical protein LOTGIDRAFT_161113 [Lottia gigantea]|uniref:C2 domain-containing protein n=1 Tax=Lottia gigantea TaxID=225164 RepID=V3ZTU5_LOTGI|nr:hypothetical protein LOTGIDRAFT_161113 [Lottia gigantea]ESO94863.1 hypothetical protein LOTGIDRAFT_161113 [Lottia gigantea]
MDSVFQALRGSKVELMISCEDLVDLDLFTKTDPICVLSMKQFGQWKEFGRTEAIRESLNPRFTDSFVLDIEPGIKQQLLFSIYDIDNRSTDLRHHDHVGNVEIDLESLIDLSITVHSVTRTIRMHGDPKSRGFLTISTELVKECQNKAQLHIQGHHLDKRGMLANRHPDCYLEIGREINSIKFQPVFRTEVIYKSRNPNWRPIELSVQKLCNNDWNRRLQFSCWHTSYGGDVKTTYKMIGCYTTTLSELVHMKRDGHYASVHLICPKKQAKGKKEVHSGSLRFYQYRVEMNYSLLDYIRGGCQLRLVLALDFTASNGNISDSLSLHNTTDLRSNQYLNAIESLGAMIARYDVEQRICVLGFGAKKSSSKKPSHCFSLADQGTDIWIKGIREVINVYKSIIPTLVFSGPTYLTPTIDRVLQLIDKNINQNNQKYYALLIITDGVINDIDSTIEKLIEASSLPLSVLFIGVGPADFTIMEQFHVDLNSPLRDKHNKLKAVRSNTYFAALRRDSSPLGSSVKVVQEALAALSTQCVQYMKSQNIEPGKPRLIKIDPQNNWITPTSLLETDEIGAFSTMHSSLSLASLRSSRHSLLSNPETMGIEIQMV